MQTFTENAPNSLSTVKLFRRVGGRLSAWCERIYRFFDHPRPPRLNQGLDRARRWDLVAVELAYHPSTKTENGRTKAENVEAEIERVRVFENRPIHHAKYTPVRRPLEGSHCIEHEPGS